MTTSLKSLRSTLAEFLSMAVLDLFPGVTLGETKVTDTTFRCSFHFLQPKHPELLSLLEEKVRGILKNPPAVELIEMSQKAAYQYFLHHEQNLKAEQVEAFEGGIIPLVRIGAFCDLYAALPYLGDLNGVSFQLLETNVDKENQHWIEIVGTGFFSKEELKAFVKHRKQWAKDKPWESAEKLHLLTEIEGSPALLPEGIVLYHQLEALWRMQISKRQDLAEVLTTNDNQLFPLAQIIRKGIAEWGKDLEGPSDRCTLFPSESQMLSTCISSLQFIQQTFTMLELNANWVLCIKDPVTVHTKQWKQEVNTLTKALETCGFSYSVDPDRFRNNHPVLELRIVDSLGEQWVGPFLSFERKNRPGVSTAIEYSLFGGIKRLIALLAELTPDKLAELKLGKWPICLLNNGKSEIA